MCARIYKIFMNRQKTLFLLFMFDAGVIWVGICRSIKRSREIFFLEAVLNLLRNNIIIASRYVPAILSLCLGINLKQLLRFSKKSVG